MSFTIFLAGAGFGWFAREFYTQIRSNKEKAERERKEFETWKKRNQ